MRTVECKLASLWVGKHWNKCQSQIDGFITGLLSTAVCVCVCAHWLENWRGRLWFVVGSHTLFCKVTRGLMCVYRYISDFVLQMCKNVDLEHLFCTKWCLFTLWNPWCHLSKRENNVGFMCRLRFGLRIENTFGIGIRRLGIGSGRIPVCIFFQNVHVISQ